MKLRVFLGLSLLIFSTTLVSADINGYLSFDFVKGQAESNSAQGSFQRALLGLIISGEIGNKVSYNSEIRVGHKGKIEFDEAYISLKPSNSFSLRLGLYLVPFGKYNISNRPQQMMLVVTPLPVKNIYPPRWRDIGLLIKGNWGGFFYSAYLGNGLGEGGYLSQGQQFEDNNKNKGKGARAGFSFGRGFEAAYSFYKGKYDDLNQRNLSLQGLDVSWTTQGFQLLAEYSRANLDNPAGFKKGKAEGYFIEFSFDWESIRPVVSYQYLKYKDAFHGRNFSWPDQEGNGIDDIRNCWSLGLVYSISKNVFFKLEYEINREEKIELKNNLFLLQLAVGF